MTGPDELRLLYAIERIATSIERLVEAWCSAFEWETVTEDEPQPEEEAITVEYGDHPPLDLDCVPEIIGADNDGEGGREL